MALHGFAPPAAPYLLGIAPQDIESIVFTKLPPKWFGDWHHAPGPQWVITLSGQWEVHTTDGRTLRQGPGEFQFNSDESAFTTIPGGHVGNTARLVGDRPNTRMIITLRSGRAKTTHEPRLRAVTPRPFLPPASLALRSPTWLVANAPPREPISCSDSRRV
jgi:hypothetical protein